MTSRSPSSSHPPTQASTNGRSSPQVSVVSSSLADVPTPEVSTNDHRGAAANPVGEDWHYESAVATVETIIHNIEAGEMELATIFDQFAIAVEHLQACETFLKHHRQQVDVLVETLTDEASF